MTRPAPPCTPLPLTHRLVEIEVVAVLPKDVPPPAMRRTRQLLGRRSAGPLRISVA